MKSLVIPLDPAKLPSAQHKGIARTGHVYTKRRRRAGSSDKAPDYFGTLTIEVPGAVGGEDANAAISISRFARDSTGLSKVVAWTHAKRVVQAFREGLYTV